MLTAPATTATDIHEWLVSKVAELAGIDVDHIDANEPVAFYGLDSVAAVSLSGELQDFLGCRVPPTLVYDCPSIEAMVNYLSTGS
jgi:acyl carrier protein